MIKLTRPDKPEELTDEFVKTQTEIYKRSAGTGKSVSVWNVDWLKNRLLEASFSKCAYCECSINVEGSYMEVEHFKDKNDFPDHVLDWDNLLPSCKRCNVKKSSHNVETEPMVNPFVDNPADHLYMQSYRIKGKTEIGKTTESVLYLNDTVKLVQKRFDVGNSLESKISQLSDLLEAYIEKNITRRRNKLIGMVTDILRECQPEEEYAATCATVVHRERTFNETVAQMKSLALWSEELEQLYNRSYALRLEY